MSARRCARQRSRRARDLRVCVLCAIIVASGAVLDTSRKVALVPDVSDETERVLCVCCGSGEGTIPVQTWRGHSWFCDSCVEAYCITCVNCEEVTQEYSYGSDGSAYCSDCWGEEFGVCERCDSVYRYGEGGCCAEAWLHDYSYRPTPIFTPELPAYFVRGASALRWGGMVAESGKASVSRQSLLYFGVELECEARGNTGEEGARMFDACGELVYFKEDGSLSYEGVEVVTHPRTLEAWQSWDAFGRALSGVRQLGWRSWDERACGLHVHVSRAGFSSRSHVMRLSSFVRRADVEAGLHKFAGRRSHYASFDTLREYRVTQSVLRQDSHYSAFNFGNDKTVEVRIFRPSLRFGRVLACIELVHALVEYLRPMSALEVKGASWQSFVKWVRSEGATYGGQYANAVRVLDGGNFQGVEA